MERLYVNEIKELTKLLTQFRDERDWSQFHDSKNLALALSIEAAEINELFLWKNSEEEFNAIDNERLAEEVADVLAYTLLLADRLALEPAEIVKAKIEKNRSKYPAEKVRGSSKKYNEYK